MTAVAPVDEYPQELFCVFVSPTVDSGRIEFQNLVSYNRRNEKGHISGSDDG
jgi:hypothetical protein